MLALMKMALTGVVAHIYVFLVARFSIVDCPTQQTRIFMRTYETLTPVLLQNLLWYLNSHFKENYFGRGENSQKPNVIFFFTKSVEVAQNGNKK